MNSNGNQVGILSEADLQREGFGAERHHSWWTESVMPASKLAQEFAKAHGKKVSEVMSTKVISASEDTPLSEISALLERHRIMIGSLSISDRWSWSNLTPDISWPCRAPAGAIAETVKRLWSGCGTLILMQTIDVPSSIIASIANCVFTTDVDGCQRGRFYCRLSDRRSSVHANTAQHNERGWCNSRFP